MGKPSCVTCCNFVKSNYYGVGECRRRAPVLRPLIQLTMGEPRRFHQQDRDGVFPTMNESDYCGEYERAEERGPDFPLVTPPPIGQVDP